MKTFYTTASGTSASGSDNRFTPKSSVTPMTTINHLLMMKKIFDSHRTDAEILTGSPVVTRFRMTLDMAYMTFRSVPLLLQPSDTLWERQAQYNMKKVLRLYFRNE